MTGMTGLARALVVAAGSREAAVSMLATLAAAGATTVGSPGKSRWSTDDFVQLIEEIKSSDG